MKKAQKTRMEANGDFACLMLPTEYLYKKHGKPMGEKGQMTAVLHKEAAAWKIQGWTWTGEKPHSAK